MFAGAAAACIVETSFATPSASIQTVLGPIPASSLGFTLPHEHVMVDFIGAQKTDRARWNVDQVVVRMKPFLMAAKQSGIRGFVDCTPAYLGRDPRVLKKLAQDTGLHILTNTGYYGDGKGLYLPESAQSESSSEIAKRWLLEWQDGIDGTGIRPGFIKIRVDGEEAERSRMTEMDRKILGAAAQVSSKTNMAVTCHSPGPSGLAATLSFAAQGGKPAKFIVAHCDDNGVELNRKIAAAGSWVSIDSIGRKPVKDYLSIVMPLLEKSPDRLLMSMDSGWFHVGEPDGGKIDGFTALPDQFLPALREAGVSPAQISRITVENPATVFTSSVH